MSGTDSNVVGIAPSVVETTALDSGIVIAPLEPAGAVSAPGAIGEVSLAKTEDFGEEEAPGPAGADSVPGATGEGSVAGADDFGAAGLVSVPAGVISGAGADSVAETSDFGTAGEVSPAGIDGCEPAGVISGTGADSVAGTSDFGTAGEVSPAGMDDSEPAGIVSIGGMEASGVESVPGVFSVNGQNVV